MSSSSAVLATSSPSCPSTAGKGSSVIERVSGRWVLDAGRSNLRVSVKVGFLATVYGRFCDMSGHVDISRDLLSSRIAVEVGTASLTSGSSHMDALLHGAGIVDSKANPIIAFESTALKAESDGTWWLHGDLATGNGSLPASLQLNEPTVIQPGRMRFRATGSLPTRDAVWLLSHPGVERLLGRHMGLDLTVEAVAV